MNEFIAKAKHLAQRSTAWDAARSGASSLGARLASAFSVSPVTAMRVLLAGVPLALLYLSLRMLAFSFLADFEHGPAAQVLARCLPFALVVGLIPVFVYAVLRTREEALSAGRAAGTGVATGAFLIVLVKLALPDYFLVYDWFSLEALTWVREDLLIIGVSLWACALLMERARGHRWARWGAGAVFFLVVAFLALLPVLVVGHMLTMGAPGGWHAIKYFAVFAGDLLPVLADELTPATATLLAAPFFIALLPFVLMSCASVRRWAQRRLTPAQRSGRGARAALFVLGTFTLALLVVPGAELSFYQPESLYASFAGNAAADLLAGDPTASLGEAPGDQSVPFATKGMTLAATDSTRRMNVAFIILESTRRRSTTPYGGPAATTPFLDSLAGRSLLVEDMFTQIPHTNKSMTPLFAGLPPRPTMEITEATPGGVPGPGLPALLEPHGYRTAFFSTVTLGFQNKRGLLRNLGFDHLAAKQYIDRHGDRDWEKLNAYGYADEAMLAPAADWLDEQAASDAPFFASFLTCVTHHPYATPASYEDRSFKEAGPKDYYNALRYEDGVLKRLFDLFEARGLLDSTLFVVVGDHGEAFGEHGVRTHGNVVWEEGLAVPALLFNPRLFPEGGTISGNRQHLDFVPTIADVLNYEVQGARRLPGRSLLAPDTTRDIRHITRNPNQGFVLRRDSLKYIYFYGRRPMEVYDVEADPMEKKNIAGRFAPEHLRGIERQMLRWRRSVERAYASGKANPK